MVYPDSCWCDFHMDTSEYGFDWQYANMFSCGFHWKSDTSESVLDDHSPHEKWQFKFIWKAYPSFRQTHMLGMGRNLLLPYDWRNKHTSGHYLGVPRASGVWPLTIYLGWSKKTCTKRTVFWMLHWKAPNAWECLQNLAFDIKTAMWRRKRMIQPWIWRYRLCTQPHLCLG